MLSSTFQDDALSLDTGAVSSSLLNVAGKVLQDECNQNAPDGVEFGETVTTSGGNLKCDVVVHGACCAWGEGPDKCKEVTPCFESTYFDNTTNCHST